MEGDAFNVVISPTKYRITFISRNPKFCVFPSIFWTPGHLFLDCVFSVVWFPAVSEHYHQSHNDHYDCEDYEDYYESTVNTVTLSFYVLEYSFILGGG